MFAGFIYILRGNNNGAKVILKRARNRSTVEATRLALIAADRDDGLGNTSADYTITMESADFWA